MNQWYEVYSFISDALLKFINNCSEEELIPGEVLYNRFINDPEFLANNNWIIKFGDKFKIYSVDPMHIFASLSPNNLSNKKRTDRINIILRILEEKPISQVVNFEGCPSPALINILSARDEDAQKEIWDLFKRIKTKKLKGLLQQDFSRYKNWYGIGFGSFSILLFGTELDEQDFHKRPMSKFKHDILKELNII